MKRFGCSIALVSNLSMKLLDKDTTIANAIKALPSHPINNHVWLPGKIVFLLASNHKKFVVLRFVTLR